MSKSKEQESSDPIIKQKALLIGAAMLGIAGLLIIALVGLARVREQIIIGDAREIGRIVNKSKIATSGSQIKEATKSPEATKSTARTVKIADSIPTNYGHLVNIPILTYHYIGLNPNPGKDPGRDNLSVAPDLFDDQLGYLAQNGFTTISLDTLYAGLHGGLLPTKPVVITIDDGYIDFYVNAFPIIKKYNMKVTAFIPTQLVGTSYYMNWSQIKELQASGLISFEAHSLHHPNLTQLSNDQAYTEIYQSKLELEAQTGVPSNFFAYPFGASNSLDWDLVKKAGFVGAVGTWFGRIETEGNIFDLPRIKIVGGTSVEEFAKKVN